MFVNNLYVVGGVLLEINILFVVLFVVEKLLFVIMLVIVGWDLVVFGVNYY